MLRRHVTRRRVAADRVADLVAQLLVERQALAQPDEQHDAHVALPLLRDRDRLGDFLDLLDLAIDLGRADAHAAGIQHRIGAAVHDQAAARL